MFHLTKKVLFCKLNEEKYDRRGLIVSFIMGPVENIEYAKYKAVDMLRHIYALLSSMFDYKRPDEYTFDEFNNCWTKFEPYQGYFRVDVSHKYWGDEQIEAFKDIIRALARLHRWELVELNKYYPEDEDFQIPVQEEAPNS